MNRIIEWLFGANAGDLAGGTDWSIDFIGEYNNYVKLALLAVMAAMVYLTVRSYRREGQTPARSKALLAGIRIAVILLVFVVVFRPAIVLQFTRTIYSSVVVLVDDSLSMSFKDHYADGPQRAALVKALGANENDLAEMTRSGIVQKVLGKDGGALSRLANDHPLEIQRFSTSQPGREPYTNRLGPPIESVMEQDKAKKPAQAAQAAAAKAQTTHARLADMLSHLSASGYDTNIPAAMRDSIDNVLQGKKGYIVVVSDGRMTADGAEGRLAGVREYAANQGYPLYTVTVGDPTPPKNVAVVALKVERQVRKNAAVPFIIKIAHRGLAGQDVTVHLQRRQDDEDDWTDVKSQTVTLVNTNGQTEQSATRGDQEIEMVVDMDDVGDFVYRAMIPARADEQNASDNAAQAVVKVADKQIKVLLVSGGAGHEFQYLKSYLLSQPELYRLSVWQESADPDVNQAASTGMKLTEFPNSLEAIMGSSDGKFPGYDVVILHDPQPTLKGFDKDFVNNLKTAVDTYGVGLCYIVGLKHSGSILSKNDEFAALRDLMPVVLHSGQIPDLISDKKPEPWPVLVTGYGMDHPAMRLGSTSEQTRQIWDFLPGIYWSHTLLAIKPAARVLAENSNPTRRLDKNLAEPLLVVQPFGRGRVMYLNFNETWRWRGVEDAKYYRAFWSGAVKYLTPSMARQVIITTGGDVFSAGEEIAVEVEAYDDDYKPLADKTFTVQMADKAGGEKSNIHLDAVADKPGRFKGTIPRSLSAHRGTYELTSLKGDPKKIEPKEIRIELPQAEAARPEADPTLMQTIATRSDYALGIEQADKLADLIPPGRLSTNRYVPRELWDSNITILLIVTLLTIEWLIRKKHNMA